MRIMHWDGLHDLLPALCMFALVVCQARIQPGELPLDELQPLVYIAPCLYWVLFDKRWPYELVHLGILWGQIQLLDHSRAWRHIFLDVCAALSDLCCHAITIHNMRADNVFPCRSYQPPATPQHSAYALSSSLDVGQQRSLCPISAFWQVRRGLCTLSTMSFSLLCCMSLD